MEIKQKKMSFRQKLKERVEQKKIPKIKEEKVEEKIKQEKIKQEKVEEELSKDDRKTKTYNKETMCNDFSDLVTYIESRIDKIRKGEISRNNTGIQFLRTINKKIKKLKTHSCRALTAKKKRKGGLKFNTGLKKLMLITDKTVKFTGWNKNELKSRVDFTRFLCSYIKEKNLQKKSHKNYIQPNKELCSYLCFDPLNCQELTYCRLQKYIKKGVHYVDAPKNMVDREIEKYNNSIAIVV